MNTVDEISSADRTQRPSDDVGPNWRTKPGERIYAIGDVHGRADLFEQLLIAIRADNASRAEAVTRIILLGDVIDRGPQSAEMVRRLVRYTRASNRFIVLKGNHEQGMASALSGEFDTLKPWLDCGGVETLISWGLDDELIREAPVSVLLDAARRAVTQDVIRWLDHLPLMFKSGNILFVHAGIRPGIAISKQDPSDLIWIREEFLTSEVLHPALVVHGHSVSEQGPEIMSNRIGIDTGAYRSGRLTAIGLEDNQRWFLCT